MFRVNIQGTDRVGSVAPQLRHSYYYIGLVLLNAIVHQFSEARFRHGVLCKPHSDLVAYHWSSDSADGAKQHLAAHAAQR